MSLVGRKLRVEYSGTTILHDLDFAAEAGELVGILGPSGSGKSTLLYALSGFRQAHQGTVKVSGAPLYEQFEELKQDIGFVPQDDIVPTALKVERVLKYAADLRLPDLSPDEREARVKEVMGLLELTERADLRVTKLSGGQRKRVSVGVELLARPDVLFADEPTSGLDPALERSLMQTFKELAAEGRVVLVTTHIMTSLDLLDMACVLHKGRMAYYGPVDRIKEYFEVEDFVRIYDALERQTPEAWVKRYEASGLKSQYITGRM